MPALGIAVGVRVQAVEQRRLQVPGEREAGIGQQAPDKDRAAADARLEEAKFRKGLLLHVVIHDGNAVRLDALDIAGAVLAVHVQKEAGKALHAEAVPHRDAKGADHLHEVRL